VVSTIKKYTLESFSERISVSNIVEIRRKSVPGGWATVGIQPAVGAVVDVAVV